MSEETSNNEEYAYLDRGGFSSEKFKIELRDLPKFYGIAELKKLMNQKLGLSVSKIKRPKVGNHWLYACFQNDEERNKAITALNGYQWKGKTLIAEAAKPAPDPLVKRKQEGTDNVKRQKTNDDQEKKSQEERLRDAVTPYWNIPYDEQLKLKEKDMKRILMKFDNEVWKIDKQKRSKIEANRKIYDGLSFELKPIQKSPITEGYRNKCEFTVGMDEETKKPTVGFRLGCYWAGSVAVAPVESVNHIPDNMKKIAVVFQEFVRNSNLAPYSPVDYTGHWKCLTVRQSTHNNDIMLIIAIDPQALSNEELDKLKQELIEYFQLEQSTACGVKSVYIHLISKRRVGEEVPKPIHLLGSTHITDTILGLQFMISPEAFFQINTAGAEILYQSAIDMSQVNEKSTVIDVCCGTGTIGLCFAKHCAEVLGLELIEKAVEDAKANAKLNNIENCNFYSGKAEYTLPAVLARAAGDDIIAIVDPPRAGLHMTAITTLRNNKRVKRLIYMSCSPASVTKNFVDLTRASSKTLHGAPFSPVCALPVDMFPHTKHVELIVLFEREQEPTRDVEKPVEKITEEETVKESKEDDAASNENNVNNEGAVET
ncbi:unnamed protein product [Colias eurytheme]|nr:unnamed protein product [Colias eurytheme]